MARLILIDGLSGTGKTNLAQDLSRELSLIGLECHVHYETDRPHPLHPIQTDAMGAAWANIHTLLTPQEFTKTSLTKWQFFLKERPSESIELLESFPFQSMVRVLFQMNAGQDEIISYWDRWQELVRTFTPTIIFLRAQSATDLINQIGEARGPEWRSYMQASIVQMPISKGLGWTGWSAVEQFLDHYSALMNELICTSDLPIVELEGCSGNYGDRLALARKRLGL